MPKSHKRQRPANKSNAPDGAFSSGESPAADFMTVGWLLTALTTLATELAGAFVTWLVRNNPQSVGLAALANVLLLTALVGGLFSLALLAAAWRLRRVKPPRGLMAMAIVICLVPAATAILRQVLP